MTSIEWVQNSNGEKGQTWNPIVGCSKVSEGCRNCYAINQAYRNNAMAQALPEDKRGRLKYYEGLTEKRGDRVEWTGKVVFVPEALGIPLKRKKPTTYFVNSMSDLFHESVTNEQLDQIFAVMALTPRHTYQVLTKRPERMLEYLTKQSSGSLFDSAEQLGFEDRMFLKGFGGVIPFKNIWLGVTVENQKAANDRIPLLLQTPAAVRFLSCEPLLEHVNIAPGLVQERHQYNRLTGEQRVILADERIHWVIVGGESGHGARPCDIKWIRSIVEQCKSANVPVFVKQLGSNPYLSVPNEFSDSTKSYRDLAPIPDLALWTGKVWTWQVSDRKGGLIDEFPDDLKIREMPINAHQAGVVPRIRKEKTNG